MFFSKALLAVLLAVGAANAAVIRNDVLISDFEKRSCQPCGFTSCLGECQDYGANGMGCAAGEGC
ncbi:hypothetical protein ACJQWK_09372 [Exserohilum turcicum]|uniref:Uncharacterized protein n=1 Tax=Exserohilum turcicum (strain 28A) TaxID=671987 RepID=R0KNI5_EXST2|nr:uncharacterized protein SETTUDRAFT_26703 [Exserohilum turcica Et28A]EOA89477.1 hypothetical protein SETTUDRAFT_26703 [Exserohilum turcica Et28A]